MTVESFFSADYQEARRKFLSAAEAAGAAMQSVAHPLAGPDGGALAMDSAWFGPADAGRVLVTLSGTHGIEGFTGSAAQIGWLQSGLQRDLPPDVAVLHVHALNPYGFAWQRRVNENNVDLNRNFLNHDAGHPENPGYDALAEAICPPQVDDHALTEGNRAIAAYGERHGQAACLVAIVAGQYRHPQGLYFGGKGLSWSARGLIGLLRGRLAGARQVASIDFHSGLGPYGYGEPMSCEAYRSPGHERLCSFYGDEVTSIGDGSMSFADNFGDSSNAFRSALPQAALAAVCLEFGTRPEQQVFDAMRRENWLHLYGSLESAEGRRIKAELRDAFYPEEAAWKDAVWTRAEEMMRKALVGLASGDSAGDGSAGSD